jgi:hypothetical protein
MFGDTSAAYLNKRSKSGVQSGAEGSEGFLHFAALSSSVVSILSRSRDRLQHELKIVYGLHGNIVFQSSADLATGCNSSHFRQCNTLLDSRFQSSADLATGCNLITIERQQGVAEFQSSADLATGCNGASPPARSAPRSFNPQPISRPAATTKRLK